MPDTTSLFDRATPMLASLNIGASLAFFQRLGFETHDFGDSDYGIAIREHIEIHFWLCADRRIAGRIDVGEVVKSPWGMDELYVWDPSGNLVKFGQVTDRFISANTVREAPSEQTSWKTTEYRV